MSLAGIPWAINTQPVNRCDQIYQPRARQVSRTMYQLREAWAELAKQRGRARAAVRRGQLAS